MATPRARHSEMHSIRQGLRCSNIEAIFATIHLALTQGIFLTNYVLYLGASNFICGVIESLPFLVQFVFFLSPLLVRRVRSRKKVAVFFVVCHRFSWLLLILLLYPSWPSEVKISLLLLILVLANSCAVIAGNAWLSWMADLVPTTIRGTYYGRRNAYLGLTSLITLFIGSQVLSYFTERGDEVFGFSMIYLMAVFSAGYAALLLSRQYEPSLKSIMPFNIGLLLRRAMNMPIFREYLVFACIWQFFLGLSAAFWGVHMVRVLGMSPALMGAQALTTSITALLASPLWGRAAHRVGERAVLLASGFIVALHVLLWLPSAPGFIAPVYLTSLLGGFAWAGFNLASFSWPQRFCGKEERQYLFGLIGAFSGATFMIGSLLGGTLTTVLPEHLFSIGDFKVLHFHTVFVLSSFGRLLAVLLVARWTRHYDRSFRSLPQALKAVFKNMQR
jgi:MFS family permease